MRKTFLILVVLMLLISLPVPALANSAEPPGIIIIANDLPEDAQITLEVPGVQPDNSWRSYRVDKLWESQYKLWFHLDMESLTGARLRITVGAESFTILLPEDYTQRYNSVMTLDFAARTLSMGQNPWRQPLLTGLRILLTLLTEGFIFWLFGFRKKSSWLVFLVVNLLTQGWLNLQLNGYAFYSSYWVLAFIGMEILIFLVEAIVFPFAVRERKVWQRIVYALAANAVSLALGILLIGRLPL